MSDQGEAIAVTINGEPHRLSAGMSVAAMLAHLGFDPSRLAVERNRDIVPRGTHGAVMVEPGDVYELVHFVGGG